MTQNPTLGDVVQVVNDNTAKIRSLYTTDATMTVPGAPALRANLAVERPRRLRLRAETAITGAEVDMGSNDELFWFWIRRNPPPTLYHCRHDKFASSAARCGSTRARRAGEALAPGVGLVAGVVG